LGQLLAQILIDQGMTSEAIQILRSLVAAYPTAVTSINILAKRLSDRGDFDESRTYLEQVIAVDKANSFAYLSWVQTKTVTVEDMDMVRSIEAAQSIRSLTEVDRMRIQFALGKAYGDLENFQTSMDSYRQANEIRESLSQKAKPFQKERVQGTLDLTREIFTKTNIESRQSDYNSMPTPIFIVGMFRSGTTLVEQILSNHTAVVAGGEMPYWMEVGADCFDHTRKSFDFDRAKALRKPYQLKLNRLSSNARYVTDKMPGNYRLLGLLRILFPRAKFIHCTRHPVDTCLSIYMTPFNTPPNYASDPEKLIFNYRLYRQTMDHWCVALGPGDIHEVRYEDLIEDPDTVTRKMLSFCELEFEEACLSPESNERTIATASAWQVRQPIYRSSVQKWRQYEPWLGEFRSLMP
jgi:tetratricopeptide (TPR) repeat protein